MDSFTYRDKVAITLTNRLTEALENKQVDESEGALIAGYLLDRINQITDDGELTLLLTEMAEKWPIFEQLFIPKDTNTELPHLVQADTSAEQEQQKQQDMTEMKKVEEALNAIQNSPQQQQEGGSL